MLKKLVLSLGGLLAVVLAIQSCGVLYGIDIAADPQSGPAALEVQFTSDTDGYVGFIQYYWDFGDGNTSEEKNPKHIFTEPDIYTVRCEATNEQTVVSTTIEIEVTE